MMAVLQEVQTEDAPESTGKLDDFEGRLKALEERPEPTPGTYTDPEPIVNALLACQDRIEEIRDRLGRKRTFHFDIHRSGGQISEVIAREVDAKPDDERLEDVVGELEAIEHAMREAPSRVTGQKKARLKALRRVQERQISG